MHHILPDQRGISAAVAKGMKDSAADPDKTNMYMGSASLT
jgi:hypothetical protein